MALGGVGLARSAGSAGSYPRQVLTAGKQGGHVEDAHRTVLVNQLAAEQLDGVTCRRRGGRGHVGGSGKLGHSFYGVGQHSDRDGLVSGHHNSGSWFSLWG